jgi:histidine ammonia-lyase
VRATAAAVIGPGAADSARSTRSAALAAGTLELLATRPSCLGSQTLSLPQPSRGRREAAWNEPVTATTSAPAPEDLTPDVVDVGPGPLTEAGVVAVARHGATPRLTPDALAAIGASRAAIEALAGDPHPHYGVSTGFGALATRHIAPELRAQLQRSLVRSHAAGSGPEVEREVVRALMLLRLSTLATGRTGVRPKTAQTLEALLAHGITPVVREYGSLGCSGDLAPLAHVALALMGEGEVRDASGALQPAADALAEAGIGPVTLAEKEGLALINGTDGMLGMLCLAAADVELLLRTADLAAAMSVEGLLGTDRVFAADLQALRPHPGQAASAANLRRLLEGSGIVASHAGPEDTRVQDAYSLRCAPQVHGAARDTLAHVRLVASRELASAVDNPVVLPDGRVESNGNFHGAPVAYALDFLAIPVADVASMSERRTDRFLDKARSHGLPPFLADDPGVDSGHMIAQYTAAGIVSELKRLAAPASVDSIPSSAMQEDHVSMGWSSGRKLRRAVDGLTRVLAVEVLTAARALDLRAPLAPAPPTAAVLARLRQDVEGPGPDRHLSPEIEATVELVRSGALVAAAESVTGPLS